ncbi:MAG: hypothetical protein M3285_05080 [Actinomycetota bacterium]|nr:hypothetical protein [Actinomycetota bacterium]
MRAKKLLVLGLVAGLIVGSLGVAAEAKKKKKPVPTPVSFYIQKVAEGDCTEEGTLFLSVTPGEDNGTCGSQYYGAPTEAASQAGEDHFFTDPKRMAAVDGVPFVLDATKTLTGTITVKSANSLSGTTLTQLGAGQSTLEVLVTGTSNGEAVELGNAEVTYDVMPGANPEPVSFEITLDEALNKAKFTTLELTLWNRGASVVHGWYASGDQSFITVPTLKKKK